MYLPKEYWKSHNMLKDKDWQNIAHWLVTAFLCLLLLSTCERAECNEETCVVKSEDTQ